MWEVFTNFKTLLLLLLCWSDVSAVTSADETRIWTYVAPSKQAAQHHKPWNRAVPVLSPNCLYTYHREMMMMMMCIAEKLERAGHPLVIWGRTVLPASSTPRWLYPAVMLTLVWQLPMSDDRLSAITDTIMCYLCELAVVPVVLEFTGRC